jgi:hypothetical protein
MQRILAFCLVHFVKFVFSDLISCDPSGDVSICTVSNQIINLNSPVPLDLPANATHLHLVNTTIQVNCAENNESCHASALLIRASGDIVLTSTTVSAPFIHFQMNGSFNVGARSVLSASQLGPVDQNDPCSGFNGNGGGESIHVSIRFCFPDCLFRLSSLALSGSEWWFWLSVLCWVWI